MTLVCGVGSAYTQATMRTNTGPLGEDRDMRHAFKIATLIFAGALWALTAWAQPKEESVCLEYPYEAKDTSDEAQRLAGLIEKLRPALAAFESLALALDEKKPQICLTPSLVLESGFLLPDANRIEIDNRLPDGMLTAVLLHELRHLDQVAAGICPDDSLAMDQVAQATFALEADANAITLLVAWHMASLGDATVWNALAEWHSTADITRRFEDSIGINGDPTQAVADAFDQWYASEDRRQRYYIATCSDYLDRRDDSKLPPSYKKLPQDYLDGICLLPDGEPYACRAPDTDTRE